MPRRKPASANPFDLLSFQDVITSTTGIMLVFTLLLVITIGTDRIITAEAEKAAELADVSEQREQYDTLQAEVKSRQEARDRLAVLEAQLIPWVNGKLQGLKEVKVPAEEPTINTLIPATNPNVSKPVYVILENTSAYILWEGRKIKVPEVALSPIEARSINYILTQQDNPNQAALLYPNLYFVYNYLKPVAVPDSFKKVMPTGKDRVANPGDAIIILQKPSSFDKVAVRPLQFFFPYALDLIPEAWSPNPQQ